MYLLTRYMDYPILLFIGDSLVDIEKIYKVYQNCLVILCMLNMNKMAKIKLIMELIY